MYNRILGKQAAPLYTTLTSRILSLQAQALLSRDAGLAGLETTPTSLKSTHKKDILASKSLRSSNVYLNHQRGSHHQQHRILIVRWFESSSAAPASLGEGETQGQQCRDSNLRAWCLVPASVHSTSLLCCLQTAIIDYQCHSQCQSSVSFGEPLWPLPQVREHPRPGHIAPILSCPPVQQQAKGKRTRLDEKGKGRGKIGGQKPGRGPKQEGKKHRQHGEDSQTPISAPAPRTTHNQQTQTARQPLPAGDRDPSIDAVWQVAAHFRYVTCPCDISPLPVSFPHPSTLLSSPWPLPAGPRLATLSFTARRGLACDRRGSMAMRSPTTNR